MVRLLRDHTSTNGVNNPVLKLSSRPLKFGNFKLSGLDLPFFVGSFVGMKAVPEV